MQILVTGGAGFVGTNLIKRLLNEGHEIVSIDNYSTGLKVNEQSGVTYVNKDIRDLDQKNSSFWNKFDVVYHMAAIARIQPSFERPLRLF
jgi:nucleoside-diphosphate-sugar epimerase